MTSSGLWLQLKKCGNDYVKQQQHRYLLKQNKNKFSNGGMHVILSREKKWVTVGDTSLRIYKWVPVTEPKSDDKSKSKKKGKDDKYGSEVTTPENSSSPGMMDMHDDNSNQSSIADSSPLKQETSNNTSPAPELTAASQSDSNDMKSDQYPSKTSDQDHKNEQNHCSSESTTAKRDSKSHGDSELFLDSSKSAQVLEDAAPPSKKGKLDSSS